MVVDNCGGDVYLLLALSYNLVRMYVLVWHANKAPKDGVIGSMIH